MTRLPYSVAILGNAAGRILRGELDPERLPEQIARCYRCNNVMAGSYSGEPECWHLAARLLLDQGLQPLDTTERDAHDHDLDGRQMRLEEDYDAGEPAGRGTT